ncbi:MAG: hypothetical protein HON70_43655, partial [Lentisphaerae bacterium]|nr:hypothetical protein [Lentisphaerota bacterium]
MRGNHCFPGKKIEYAVWSPVRRSPWQGFGLLRLCRRDQDTFSLERLRAKLLGPGRIWVTGRFRNATQQPTTLGPVRLRAWLSDAFAPPRMFAETVAFASPEGTVDWLLEYPGAIDGDHRLTVSAEPASPAQPVAPGIGLLRFRMDLPSPVKVNDIVLLPRPKTVAWRKGAFQIRDEDTIGLSADATPRTIQTAELMAEYLYGHTGVRPAVSTVAGSGSRLRLSIAPGVSTGETGAADEAYTLNVSAAELVITGAGEHGLYYGVVTLRQIMKATKQPAIPIPAVHIQDWAYHRWRIYHEWLHHPPLYDEKHRNGYDVERMKRVIEDYVAGAKYNLLVLQVDRSFRFDSIPEFNGPRDIPPEKYRELCDFARSHFLEVVPGVHFGSHSFVAYMDPSRREEGMGPGQMDVTKPGTAELMTRMYEDIITAAGPPLRFFHTNNDEWWRPIGDLTLVHNGKTRKQIFLEHLLAQHRVLKEHGLRMIMLNDMLEPNHAGGPPMNLFEVAAELPRDIVISSWSYSTKRFHEMGFETWQEDNGCVATVRDPGRHIAGFGTLVYSCIYSLFHFMSDARAWSFGWHTALAAAEFGWNRNQFNAMPTEPWAAQYMPNLMGTFSNQPNPHANGSLTPITIDADEQLSGRLALTGTHDLAGVPMQLTARAAASDASLKQDLPAGTRASSLILLHAVDIPDTAARNRLKQLLRKHRPHGLPVGQYVLEYDDATTVAHNLRLGINIMDLCCPTLNRYVRYGRYVHPLNSEGTQAMLQFEWVNPYPEKVIRSITLEAEHKDAPILVGGLTLRGVKESGATLDR